MTTTVNNHWPQDTNNECKISSGQTICYSNLAGLLWSSPAPPGVCHTAVQSWTKTGRNIQLYNLCYRIKATPPTLRPLTSSFWSSMSRLCASVQRFTSRVEIFVSSEISAWANSLRRKGESREGYRRGPVLTQDVGITLQRVPALAWLVYAATRGDTSVEWWECNMVMLLTNTIAKVFASFQGHIRNTFAKAFHCKESVIKSTVAKGYCY